MYVTSRVATIYMHIQAYADHHPSSVVMQAVFAACKLTTCSNSGCRVSRNDCKKFRGTQKAAMCEHQVDGMWDALLPIVGDECNTIFLPAGTSGNVEAS